MKKSYFKTLSFFAHWYLPPGEAADVLNDYREMIADAGEEKAKERFGSPRKAVKELAEKSQRLRWTIIFALLCLCPLISLVWLAFGNIGDWYVFQAVAAIFGTILSLFTFGMGDPRPMSRPLFGAILAMCVFAAGCLATILFYLFHLDWIVSLKGRAGATVSAVLGWMIGVSLLVSLGGIVLARLQDRRWRCLYILGLTVIVLCANVYRVLKSMDPSYDIMEFSAQLELAMRLVAVVGVGLCAGGIGLC